MLEAAALSLLILGDSLSTDLPHLVAGGGTPYSVVVAERSDGATTNAAVYATTSRQWNPETGLSYYANRAKPAMPVDWVIILLGSNDASGFGQAAPTPPEEYVANIEALALTALEDGAGRVLLGIPPHDQYGRAETAAHLAAYREELLNLCDEIPAIDCGPDYTEVLSAEAGHYSFEEWGGFIHPNESGHLAMAEAVWTLVPEPDAFALHAAALLVLIFHRALHTVAPTGALRPGTGSARAPWRDERSAQAKAFSTTSRAQT